MPSISGNNQIGLKIDFAQHEEGPLVSAAKPGQNVKMSPAASQQGRDSYAPGGTDYVGTGTAVTVTGGQQVMVLDIDGLSGRTINDAFAAGENVKIIIPKKGDVLQVLVAAGQTVLKDRGLSAGLDGKFITDLTNPSVQALEASGGALGADTHMRVRVL